MLSSRAVAMPSNNRAIGMGIANCISTAIPHAKDLQEQEPAWLIFAHISGRSFAPGRNRNNPADKSIPLAQFVDNKASALVDIFKKAKIVSLCLVQISRFYL